MITVTIQVKPYLAAYLQSAYAHCTVEGAIRFTKTRIFTVACYSSPLPAPRACRGGTGGMSPSPCLAPVWGKTRGPTIIWERRP